MADYIEKEFYVNTFNKYLFMHFVLPVFLGCFCVSYYYTKSVVNTIIYTLCGSIPFIVFIYLMSYLASCQKVVLKLKENILDINFVRRNSSSKLYSINLSRVISYKEVPYRHTGYMEFYYDNDECVKVPYSMVLHKQLRDEIVNNILKNYNIEEKLAF